MTRLADFVGTQSMADLYDRYWVPAALDVFARELAKRVHAGAHVLDLGTGTGLVAGYASERAGPAGKVTGLDPTTDLLDAAKAKQFLGAHVSWMEGSAEEMPFEDESFEIVLCHQGLQYVSDRAATFSEIKRVLKPGGQLHVGVWSSAARQPAFGFVEDSLASRIGPEQKPIHAWSFGGQEELRRLADAASLTIERLETVEHPWRFDSIQQFIDVQIACAGRTDDNGQLAMGLVDLEDESWLPAIEAFGRDAHAELGQFVTHSGLSAPFASDEMSAMA
jgi:ubiquinone/menaquinone biosynthesis C-methylase UbiE